MLIVPPSTERGPKAAARSAGARAAVRMTGAIADFFLPDDVRLDDRTRTMLTHLLAGVVRGLDLGIRRHAARLLAQRGRSAAAERLLGAQDDVVRRIARPGLLPDALMEELIARVRHDLLADALPVQVSEPDEPSLLVRLAGVPDAVVAAAAAALLAAENRRRGAVEPVASELPAELHHRLAWLVAAALHDGDADTGRALAEATMRVVAAHDEGDRLDAVALRLAIAIDARPDELPTLLADALGDRRLALFIAVLARALGVEFAQVRALVTEPDDARLWLALRAVGVDRSSMARIALALADADPQRDIEAFADEIDSIAAVTTEEAHAAVAPLALPADFRAACRALEAS